MYLSRIAFNTDSRETQRALDSPQILHAAVEGCFQGKKSAARNLWRVDALREELFLLLLSRERPDFARFSEQFGSPSRPGETRDYGVFLGRIAQGQAWRFRLRANPVHSEKAEDGGRGKVYAHVTSAQQRQWLAERAERNGFLLSDDSFDVVKSELMKFRRENKTVTLGTAVFEGILTVKDVALCVSALENGIGRAKAYGCGLLTLARQ